MQKFVIKSGNGNYIGIDRASGGYPFETENINSAYLWTRKEDAYNYKLKFPKEDWTLHTVHVTTVPTRWF